MPASFLEAAPWLPHSLPRISSEPYELLSLSLSLLLLQRLQAAYDRYWEARGEWRRVLDTCRTVARRGLAFGADTRTGERIARMAVAIAACCREHLSFRRDISDLVVTRVISPADYRNLAASGNLPEAACSELARIVDAAAAGAVRGRDAAPAGGPALSESAAAALSQSVDDIADALGNCEKVALTPIPYEFAAHTSRFLTLFCFGLPLLLVDPMGAASIPYTALISFSLLGIEAVGSQMEAPFSGPVALDDGVAVLRADVMEMIERSNASRGVAVPMMGSGGRRQNPPACSLPRWGPQ